MSKIIVRRKATLPGIIVTEKWLVLVFIGEETIEFNLTCEKEEFAAAMQVAGYDILDPQLDYVRELIED